MAEGLHLYYEKKRKVGPPTLKLRRTKQLASLWKLDSFDMKMEEKGDLPKKYSISQIFEQESIYKRLSLESEKEHMSEI